MLVNMSRVQELTDDALMQSAGNAGRNLSALAILATILAVFCAIFCVLEPRSPIWWSALPLILTAVSYWMLAVAAKRGNPSAVSVVIVVMAIQLIFSLISMCVAAAVTGSNGQSNIIGIIIAILIISALAKSRTVLLEMKKRELWGQKFSSAKPSRNLYVVGGILLPIGYFGVLASLLIPATVAAKQAKEIAQERQQFVQVVKGEEAEFMKAMLGLRNSNNRDAIKLARSKVDVLDKSVVSLQSKVEPDGSVGHLLVKYKKAVSCWKKGLSLLDDPTPNSEAVVELLESGDRIRNEVGQEFDKKVNSR